MGSRFAVSSRKGTRVCQFLSPCLHSGLTHLLPEHPYQPGADHTQTLWHPLACQQHHARLHQRLLQPRVRGIAAAGPAQQLRSLPTTPHQRLAAGARLQRPAPEPAATAASGGTARWVGGGLRGWERQVDDQSAAAAAAAAAAATLSPLCANSVQAAGQRCMLRPQIRWS